VKLLRLDISYLVDAVFAATVFSFLADVKRTKKRVIQETQSPWARQCFQTILVSSPVVKWIVVYFFIIWSKIEFSHETVFWLNAHHIWLTLGICEGPSKMTYLPPLYNHGWSELQLGLWHNSCLNFASGSGYIQRGSGDENSLIAPMLHGERGVYVSYFHIPTG
jgi:hypothetical protein